MAERERARRITGGFAVLCPIADPDGWEVATVTMDEVAKLARQYRSMHWKLPRYTALALEVRHGSGGHWIEDFVERSDAYDAALQAFGAIEEAR